MSDPRPKWDPGIALRAGVAAHKLAVDHRKKLEDRLDAGVIDGLGIDVATLRAATAETPAVHLDKEASTVTQDDAVVEGALLVAAVRTAATRSHNADATLRKSLGVGTKVQSTVSSVEAALQAIIDTGVSMPKQVRAIGVLSDDLKEAAMLLASLGTADDTQERKKVSSKVSTKDRNAAHLRVEAAVDEIVAKAALAFRKKKDKGVAKLFADLIPGSAPTKPAKATGTP